VIDNAPVGTGLPRRGELRRTQEAQPLQIGYIIEASVNDILFLNFDGSTRILSSSALIKVKANDSLEKHSRVC
jgi:hypothetical protein